MKVLKTQLDAVEFLTNQGFKVSKSKFGRDVNDGKVATTVEGFFEDGALLAYASLHLTPLAKAENRALTDANVNRLAADADLKRLTAERARLKLEKEKMLLQGDEYGNAGKDNTNPYSGLTTEELKRLANGE